MLKSSIQSKILTKISDNRPVTAIQVIENIEKCPSGFHPINRTYDQDQDADLRESSIFKFSPARYLCISKSQGLPNFVIKEILVLNDKHNPPQGFSLLTRTADSEQKAWKKKQICYRLVNLKDTNQAVTDIIICSRLKKAPEGFKFAGELNGVTLCYKMGNTQDGGIQNPNGIVSSRVPRPAPPPPPLGVSPGYPTLDNNDHDYEILLPGYPPIPGGYNRPAPRSPAPAPPIGGNSTTGATHTLGLSHSAMEGIPFMINPKFFAGTAFNNVSLPMIKAKTMQQILKDYDYPFSLEKQTLMK